MKKYTGALVPILLFLAACGKVGVSGTPALGGPYLGQTPPGAQAVVFAPGIVSASDTSEYSGTFSPDGNEYYFYRFAQGETSQLLYTHNVDGQWTPPQEPAFSAGYAAFEPHITHDNQRLYFAWDHPLPSGETPKLPGIFFVERTADGWSEAQYAGQGMFVSSSWDGQIYITDMSTRERDGKTYLARVTSLDGVFTGYERLEIKVPSGQPAHPCPAPDGSYLIFDVNGGSHLFVSFRQADGTWGTPIDLGEHGFDRAAGGAYISPDAKYLFFGLRGDIWWVDISVIEALRPGE